MASRDRPESDQVQCPHCPNTYHKQWIDRHIRDTHLKAPRPFICTNCGSAHTTEKGLKLHITSSHRGDEKGFECEICSEKYHTAKALREHLERHKTRAYACPTCHKPFKTDVELQDHIQKTHGGIYRKPPPPDPKAPNPAKPYKCPHCGAWLQTPKSWIEHVDNRHIRGEVVCDECEKTFVNIAGLRSHKRDLHAPQKFNCSYCGKLLATNYECQQHEKSCTVRKAGGKHKQATDSLPKKQPQQPDKSDKTSQGQPVEEITDKSQSSSTDSLTNIRAPYDSVEFYEYQYQKVSALFSEDARKFVQEELKVVRSALERSTDLTLSAPTPAQQHHMGSNLQRFRLAQLVDSLPSVADPILPASDSLKKFVQQPKKRKLWAGLDFDEEKAIALEIVIKTSGDVDVPKQPSEVIVFGLEQYQFPEDVATAVTRSVKRLLETIPIHFRELSNPAKTWSLYAAQKLAFESNQSLKVSLPVPELKAEAQINAENSSDAPKRLCYVVTIYGYDAMKQFAWRQKTTVGVGTVDVDRNVVLPHEARYQWLGQPELTYKRTPENFAESDFKQAYRVAQMVSITYTGFVGSVQEFHTQVGDLVRSFWLKGKQQTHAASVDKGKVPKVIKSLRSSLGDRAMWQHFRKSFGHRFEPSFWFANRMTGRVSSITTLNDNVETSYMIAKAMFDAAFAGHAEDLVWGVGAAMADHINFTYSEPLPPIESCSNTNHSKELHICPECLKVVRHQDFKATELRHYSICKPCAQELEGSLKGIAVEKGMVGWHLFCHLKHENDLMQGDLTISELKRQANQILNSISHLFLDGGRSYDAYANQILDVSGPKVLTWDGNRLNCRYPSIDAIDPAVVGKDKKIHYHVEGNITVTSLSINLMIGHHQKVLLNAILQLVEAPSRGQDVYENAIAIFRNCLINHHEYGPLGHSQQTARVGTDPPPYMAAITESFRSAKLLPRTVPKEVVWKCFQAERLNTKSHRVKWKPQHHSWVMHQLDLIAQEVFGTASEAFRKYWVRPDPLGEEVFFPFSQYSVAIDFTWWDLYEVMSVKIERNIKFCQRYEDVPRYSVEELILTVANLWMRMIKKDIDKGLPSYDLGRDEAGFICHPNINWLLCASLGHRWPNVLMDLGLDGFDTNNETKVAFDAARCGMLWETQLTNMFKWKFSLTQTNEIFQQLSSIRRGNPPGEQRRILPQTDVHVELRDETGFSLPKASRGNLRNYSYAATRRNLRAPQKKLDPSQIALQESLAQEDDFELPGIDRRDTAEQEVYPTDIYNAGEVEDATNDIAMVIAAPQSLARNLQEMNQPIVAERRNLTNIGNTCYISSIVQVIANIPAFKEIFINTAAFRPDTGRDPRLLKNMRDEDGSKHVVLFTVLSEVLDDVQSYGGQLAKGVTENLLNAISNLAPGFDNAPNDAGGFYAFLMEACDLVMDQSEPISGPDVYERRSNGVMEARPAYRPWEVANCMYEVALAEDGPIPALEKHISDNWKAYEHSGHSSSLTKLMTIQRLSMQQCGSEECESVFREISYAHQIIVNFPENLSTDALVPLNDLMYSTFRSETSKNDLAANQASRMCPNAQHAGQSDLTHSRLKHSVTRVARAGAVFAIEIDRKRAPPALSSDEEDLYGPYLPEYNPEENPHMNRICDYATISMSDWSNGGPSLKDKPMLGARSPAFGALNADHAHGEYKIVAILAFSDTIKHYTAFVKIGGDWIYFDDLQPSPVRREPFSQWPQGFVEKMLWYVRSESPEMTMKDITSVALQKEQPAQVQNAPKVMKGLQEHNAQLLKDNDELKSILKQIGRRFRDFEKANPAEDTTGQDFYRDIKTLVAAGLGANTPSPPGTPVRGARQTIRKSTPFLDLVRKAKDTFGTSAERDTDTPADTATESRAPRGEKLMSKASHDSFCSNFTRGKCGVTASERSASRTSTPPPADIERPPPRKSLAARRRPGDALPEPLTIGPRVASPEKGSPAGSLTDTGGPLTTPTPAQVLERSAIDTHSDRRRDRHLRDPEAPQRGTVVPHPPNTPTRRPQSQVYSNLAAASSHGSLLHRAGSFIIRATSRRAVTGAGTASQEEIPDTDDEEVIETWTGDRNRRGDNDRMDIS